MDGAMARMLLAAKEGKSVSVSDYELVAKEMKITTGQVVDVVSQMYTAQKRGWTLGDEHEKMLTAQVAEVVELEQRRPLQRGTGTIGARGIAQENQYANAGHPAMDGGDGAAGLNRDLWWAQPEVARMCLVIDHILRNHYGPGATLPEDTYRHVVAQFLDYDRTTELLYQERANRGGDIGQAFFEQRQQGRIGLEEAVMTAVAEVVIVPPPAPLPPPPIRGANRRGWVDWVLDHPDEEDHLEPLAWFEARPQIGPVER